MRILKGTPELREGTQGKDKLGVGRPSLKLGFRLDWRSQPTRWQRRLLGCLAQSWYTVVRQEEAVQGQGSPGGWVRGSRVLGGCFLAGGAWPRICGVDVGRAMRNSAPGVREAKAGGQVHGGSCGA